MGRRLFLIFNHEITPLQEDDARRSLGARRIVDLPSDLKELWRHIPPELPEICNYLAPIKVWLKDESKKSDYVLIQGDFGATYIMVNVAFKFGLVPVYSTTNREAVEKHESDGAVSLTHRFKHQIFRKYGV